MTTERRRYFRIEEQALIKYRVIQEDMLDEERKFIFLNEIKVENVHAALVGIDLRLQDLLSALRRENKLVAEAVDLLNRKLTLLERVVALEHPYGTTSEYREHDPTQVNISGGGVSLTQRNGVLADLRTSKEHGQSNFNNPGLLLFGVGTDLDLLPEFRLSMKTFAKTMSSSPTCTSRISPNWASCHSSPRFITGTANQGTRSLTTTTSWNGPRKSVENGWMPIRKESKSNRSETLRM